MYLCLIIAIDRERSTLLVTVNTFCALVYFAANVNTVVSPYCFNGTYDSCQYSILFPQPRFPSKMANS